LQKYKAGYGGHSETERVLVNNDGLAIQSLLKIQSGPLGNLGESPFDGDKHLVPKREREKRYSLVSGNLGSPDAPPLLRNAFAKLRY
jgi:hypothetical protein